jgi:hypothetical protein
MGVDVDDRSGTHFCARRWVMVGRTLGLDDQHSDAAVAPAVDAVDVIVPKDVVEHHVGIPPVLDELRAGPFARGVIGLQSVSQSYGLGRSIHRHDLMDVYAVRTFADGDPGLDRVAVGVGPDELRHAGQL